MAFAETTRVPVGQSKAELEKLVSKHRCSQFMSGTDYDKGVARVQFKAHDRFVRFVIAMPKRSAMLDRKAAEKFEQQERQRWRALLLVVKAKFECIETGIATFEEEFLAHIVMPNDRTVAEMIMPQIESAYKTGTMPKMIEGTVEDVK